MTRRSGGLVTLDLVAVLLLVASALVGLSTTYAGWGFLVVGVVAATLGVLLAASTARLPVTVLVATTPVVALLLGGPVALRSPGLGGGIPDLQTMADVMQGSWTGWGELLTTLPYVDLAGPPAMVPFLLGFVGATVAASVALRSRSAAGPLLPLLVVLGAVLLLRRTVAGPLDAYPVVFAAIAIGWTALRGLEFSPERDLEVRGSTHGRLTRAVTAAVVVVVAVGVAASITPSTSATSGESVRGRVGELLSVDGLDSPLRRFRSFTEQANGSQENVHRRLLLTVTGAPRGSRVRMVTLDTYDGSEWLAANGTMAGTDDDSFLRMDTQIDNPTRGRAVRVQVSVARAYRSAWVPTIGSLTSLRFLFSDADSRRSQLRYDLATSTAVVPVGIERGNDYEFTAIVPQDQLRRGMRPWTGPGLQVADLRRVDPLVRRVLASPAPAMRKVFVLARYLREEGRYSNGSGRGESGYLPGQGIQRLTDGFLLAPRPVGDDEQYASAMALLANRVGVPARVVVGAVLPRDGQVRGRDVHAWVELRVADGTWRTLDTATFMGDRPPRRHMTPAPRPRITTATGARPTEPVTRPEAQRQQQERRQASDSRRSLVLRLLPWLVLLLLVTAVPLAKLVRRRLRRTRGRGSDRMAAAWTELVDHARDLGIAVPLHVSRPAQARSLALAGAGGGPLAEELPRAADDGVFAAAEPEPAAVAAYWDQVGRERRRLSAGRPLRRRAWAIFNPISLWRRRPGD